MPRTAAPQPIYVPVLKGKEGEYGALEALPTGVRARLMPLIEIPDVPYDYTNEGSTKSLDDHLSGTARRLKKCCQGGPLYLDLPWFEGEERLSDGTVALESVLADCARQGVRAVPVVSRKKSADYLAAAGRYMTKTDTGACLRLLVPDFAEDVDVEAEVHRLLGGLGAADTSSIDLVLDLEDLGLDTARASLVARSVFSMIPAKDEWRRIVLVAASFPEDLSDVDAATVTTLPRREWDLWRTLQKRPGLLPRRDLIFGDYGIAHPITKELDPRTMRMSASIRYTTPKNWLVLKGRNVRKYGFDQYFELCKELVRRPEYQGRDFSSGDKYISDCAEGMTGPGNATTWRKVGTNHHITLVADQIANLRASA
jgi:hypothetical protein